MPGLDSYVLLCNVLKYSIYPSVSETVTYF